MSDIKRLLSIMETLRDPDKGCPWDQKQTFKSIAPYTIEEAYEVAHAIELGDYRELRDELGDLLFQIAFYVQMAKEQQLFSFDDVLDGICEKMVRRHPHVFEEHFHGHSDEDSINKRWEEIKRDEKGLSETNSVLDGLTKTLPALSVAVKIQKKVAKVGFDWTDTKDVIDKIREEIEEVEQEIPEYPHNFDRIEDEIGDLMFACANLARHFKVDPEQSLRRANQKFELRFRELERQIAQNGNNPQDHTLEELENYWQMAKKSLDK